MCCLKSVILFFLNILGRSARVRFVWIIKEAMWLVGVLLAVALTSSCWARDYTFTVKLARGTSECFYDYIHEGAFLEIEYQVRGCS